MKKNNKYSFSLILLDILIIVISLVASWMIRSRFKEFFYTIEGLLFIMPYVILTRILVTMLLEGYSYYYNTFQREMIIKIFKINIYSSLLFLFLRLFSPIQEIRMPLAIIFTEYMVTSAGMMFIRYFFYRNIKFSDNKIIPEMGVFSSNFGIHEKKTLQNIINNNDVKISFIYTKSVTDLDSSFLGIPVSNSERETENIIIIGNPDFEEKMIILNKSEKIGRNVYCLDKNAELRPFSISDLFLNSFIDNNLPHDVDSYFGEEQIKFYGSEVFKNCQVKSPFMDFKSVFTIPDTDFLSVDTRFLYSGSINPEEQYNNEIMQYIEKYSDSKTLLLLPLKYKGVINNLKSRNISIAFTGTPVITGYKLFDNNYYDIPDHIIKNSLKLMFLIVSNNNYGKFWFIKTDLDNSNLNFINNFVNKGFKKNLEQIYMIDTEKYKLGNTVFNDIYELKE